MRNFIKKHHKILIGAGILILVVMAYFIYTTSNKSQAATQYVVEAVNKQTLIISVSGTGQVSALNQIDLKSQTSGTVTSVSAQVGQNVKAGQVLATLDQKNALLSINQAKANLDSAQANYDKLVAGPASLDLQSSQNAVNSAQQSLVNAQRNLDNVIKQQQTAVNNALSNLLNAGITPIAGPTNISTQAPAITGTYNGTDQGSYYISLYSSGSGLSYSVTGLENQIGPTNTTMAQPLGTRGLYIQFSNMTSIKANDSWTILIPNKTASNYLSNYNAYQTALQNQPQAITSAQTQIDTAQSNLEQAQTALEQKKEPAASADLATAKSQVDSARAQLEAAQKNYSDNIITAPFDGQVAAVNAQKGDQIGASTLIVTLVTNQQIAEVSLNEIDAAKVKTGEKATMTFDAISDLTLTGKVIQVDVIGAVSQGVVSYGVKIGFDTQDERIKPGMSVSADIITDVKQDVLAVPSSAVKSQNSQSYIQILNSTTNLPLSAAAESQITSNIAPENQTVTVGVSNDTMTEITSGIKEGDIVVVQTVTSGTSATTSSNSSTGTQRSGSSGIRIPGLGGGF